jgi:hypothetical protein
MEIGKYKKIVHFLSASDRINYGDLLFPIIFEQLTLYADIKVINYGIVKSDLRNFGALPTNSYVCLQSNIKKYGGNLIIGGGEVLFVDWASLLAFISPLYSKLLYNGKFSLLESKFNYTRYLLSNGRVVVPFSPNKNELNTKLPIRIIYNSVGGTFENSRLINMENIFKRNLMSADYISVRDNRVVRSLNKNGIQSVLVPDSAIVISDIFKGDLLAKKSSLESSLFKDEYIFVQLGNDHSPLNLELFSEDLENLSKKLDCKIILCPIGMAPRHEDHVILSKIKKICPEFNFILPNSIYDIILLISRAKAYLGTSLHGLITAQSYNIPFIPLNRQIVKVEEYCKTWTFANIDKNIDYRNIMEAEMIIKNWNFKTAKVNLNKQKLLVYNNFENILQNLI